MNDMFKEGNYLCDTKSGIILKVIEDRILSGEFKAEMVFVPKDITMRHYYNQVWGRNSSCYTKVNGYDTPLWKVLYG